MLQPAQNNHFHLTTITFMTQGNGSTTDKNAHRTVLNLAARPGQTAPTANMAYYHYQWSKRKHVT